MGWWKRKPKAGTAYEGPVCFWNGAHYPVEIDRNGNEAGPDLSRRLLWREEDGGYVYAADTDPTHFHVYHQREVEIRRDDEVTA